MFPMEFYFPQICGKLIPAVALDWTDFGGICFCGKRNIMRMFTHFAKNGEIRLAK